ncbi:hypothetical protein BH18ACT15_BH18ACT15_06120 [soil metagenome]
MKRAPGPEPAGPGPRLPWDPEERVVAPGDPEWPAALSELGPHKAVPRLFVTGRVIDPAARRVAVVGTRRPTAAGIEAAERLARDLTAKGFVVVSGLALGIDAVAHRAALDAGGPTVAVVGAGLDADYPVRNRALRARIKRAGTVVSEHPKDVSPAAYNFPARHRIIAGLAEAVIVVEGTTRSGAMITARQALDANREVFAVPGSIRNVMATGPNELLRRSQAGLATEARHVLEEIAPELADERGPLRAAASAEAVGEEEVDVLALLDDAPVDVDRLVEALGAPVGQVTSRLAKLEVRGLVSRRRAGYEITGSGAAAREAALAPRAG